MLRMKKHLPGLPDGTSFNVLLPHPGLQENIKSHSPPDKEYRIKRREE
jgi:hypothetical protein